MLDAICTPVKQVSSDCLYSRLPTNSYINIYIYRSLSGYEDVNYWRSLVQEVLIKGFDLTPTYFWNRWEIKNNEKYLRAYNEKYLRAYMSVYSASHVLNVKKYSNRKIQLYG